MTTKLIDSTNLYDIYRVKVAMRDKLCGGVPKNPDVLGDWIKAKTGHDDAQTIAQTEEAKQALLDTEAEKSWTGFFSDAKQGVFIEARNIKAMFKECASVLRITVDKRGSKQILQHGFEIKAPDGGSRIFLDRAKADGFDETPIHVTTPQGPRTALKRIDYVMGAVLNFHVWVLGTHAAETRHIGEDDLMRMLALAQENGLGADRSQGRGKLDVIEFEKVASAKKKEEKEKAK